MINTRRLTLIFFVLFLLLQYKLWIADDGIAETLQLRKSISAQVDVNDRLAKHNRKITTQVAVLKQGSAAIEALAREELGMVKPNEQYYQFVG